MHPIFLIGFMGCGKTTLGRALGALSSLRFVDLDSHIEARTHKTITELFRNEGEEKFRQIEHELLEELAGREDIIIACGGGTPCFHNNMELMNHAGLTVFIDTSRECIMRRLKAGRRRRPLVAALGDSELEAYVDTTFEQRRPVYDLAKATFAGDLLETGDEILLSATRFKESFNLP